MRRSVEVFDNLKDKPNKYYLSEKRNNKKEKKKKKKD